MMHDLLCVVIIPFVMGYLFMGNRSLKNRVGSLEKRVSILYSDKSLKDAEKYVENLYKTFEERV